MFRAWRGYRAFCRIPVTARGIVFYAEGRNDWQHFSGIISLLTRQHQMPVHYLTSDPDDVCFASDCPGLRCFYIGDGVVRTWAFQVMKARLVILTLMDLHNYQLKRSLYPVHYLYLFHSAGSTHMVDHANSYDHYDSLLCAGPHHVAEIRRREELAGLPAKDLIAHGHRRIERLVEEMASRSQSQEDREQESSESQNAPSVLLAPTWGETSILNQCGMALISVLLKAGFRVILRPHYQSLKLSAGLIRSLCDKFSANPNFSFIDQMAEEASLFESDLLICDWSAMAIEYSLALEKPVLFIDVPPRVRNPDWRAWQLTPMEIAIREQVGKVVRPDDLDAVPPAIRALLSEPEAMRRRMRTIREKYLFNFGHSDQVAVKEILTLWQRLGAAGGEQQGRAEPTPDGSSRGHSG